MQRNLYLAAVVLPARIVAALLIYLGVAIVLLLYAPLEGWAGVDRRLALFRQMLAVTLATDPPAPAPRRGAVRRR